MTSPKETLLNILLFTNGFYYNKDIFYQSEIFNKLLRKPSIFQLSKIYYIFHITIYQAQLLNYIINQGQYIIFNDKKKAQQETQAQNDKIQIIIIYSLLIIMYYQKAVQILKNTLAQQGFQFFLSLNYKQLTQIIECVSEEDQQRIYNFLQNRSHMILPPAKPTFIENVKQIHNKINFNINPVSESEEEQKKQVLADILKSFQKEKIIEYRSNYPYYQIVKKLMYVNGINNPEEQSIKMMHSQLYTMIKLIFKQNLLAAVHRRCQKTKQTYLIDQVQTKVSYSENCKTEQKDLKKYLSFIFSNQYIIFIDFKRNYKEIKKQEYEQLVDSSKSQNGQDEESQIAYISEIKPVSQELDQQTQYFLRRTSKMNQEEFNQYAKCRYLNFLIYGNEKFGKFLDANNLGISKMRNKELLQLLSYILCKSLKSIVFQILRLKNNGQLKETTQPITSQDIKNVGNQYIDRIVKRARTYALKNQSYIKKAFQLFEKQFFTYDYDKIFTFNQKIKLLKINEQEIICDKSTIVNQVWKKNKNYRKVWYQRIVAQTQISKYIQQEQFHTFRPLNEYSQYLYKHLDQIKLIGYPELFKRFFLKITTPVQTKVDANKKGRLQSLFD